MCPKIQNLNAQVLYSADFNIIPKWIENYVPENQWREMSAIVSNSEVVAKVSLGKFGTVDIANTTIPSDAMQLLVENTGNQAKWTAGLSSGLLAIKNTESNLGKITVSFDHSVSVVQPVWVRIESFDAQKKRTGGLEKVVYPATAGHFLHSAFELADMKAFGDGKFNPIDSYVNFTFLIEGPQANNISGVKPELRIDNFAYSLPAYYVSPTGKDSNDGRTEKTAFANPQAALNVAKPGDIILLMEGSYESPTVNGRKQKAVASFVSSGLPATWLTLKNYPGHKPVIRCIASDGIHINQGTKTTYLQSPLLAYIDVRGLHIKGNSDEVFKLYPSEIGYSTANTETRGIYICAKTAPTRMYHHIRVANCLIELCGTDGMWASEVDYLTVENNVFRDNCWTTVGFAMAGFSLMMYADFDKIDNVTKIVVRNNQAYGNQRKVGKKVGEPKWYNGNGMIFDANCEPKLHPDFYLGRTLIQNNLVYGNGGGGIQNWGSHRLDIVNNTIYHNGITPELKWGNIGLDFCKDVRIINNIVVALPDRPLDFWLLERTDRDTANIVRINNLYFGGVKPNIKGRGDLVADPMFVNPSLDPKVADFRLKPGSPAIGKGVVLQNDVPCVNLDEKKRFVDGATINPGVY